MEKNNGTTYEDLQQAVDDYGEHGGEDMLTDPAAVAQANDERQEASVTHSQRLRQTREEQGFTIAELAEKTGVDERQLSATESGETLLPLGDLIKVTKALSLRMTDIIGAGQESFTIVKASERRRVSRFGQEKQASHGYEYESLASRKRNRRMEPFIVTLHPAASDETSSHDGQEFIYVLEGEMEVVVDDTRQVLQPGDCVYYDSTSPHMVRAFGDKPSKILAVLVS
jgi:mannose-6-phosphate isomerase-like protein (cupin superfamily)/DNA-binding XRE family transcriptional regulator